MVTKQKLFVNMACNITQTGSNASQHCHPIILNGLVTRDVNNNEADKLYRLLFVQVTYIYVYIYMA